MADDKLTLFPKRTLRALCTVRILLASVTLVWLGYFLSVGRNTLTRAALFAPLAQIVVSVVGLTWTSVSASRASVRSLLLLALVPVIGFIYPVVYLAPFYFFWIWSHNSSYHMGDEYDRAVAGWTYFQCLEDTFLALATFSICWGALAEAPFGGYGLPSAAVARVSENLRDRDRSCKIIGLLHMVAVGATFVNLVFGWSGSDRNIHFVSYLELILGNCYFFAFAAIAALFALFGGSSPSRRRSSSHLLLTANIASLASAALVLLVFVYGASVVGAIGAHAPEETTSSSFVFVGVLGLVGLYEVILSSFGVAYAKKLKDAVLESERILEPVI